MSNETTTHGSNTHHKISTFSTVNNAKSTIPNESLTLKQIYLLIIGSTFKKIIDALRAEADEIKQSSLKAKIRAFCVGGLFSVRNEKGFSLYASFVHADVDKLTPAQMIAFDEILRSSPFVSLFFISPRGKGFKIFAKVNTPAEQHLQAWKQFNKYITDLLGVATDPAPKSIASICFFSHDPNAFYNEDSEVFEVKEIKEVEQRPETSLQDKHFELKPETVDRLDKYILKQAGNIIQKFNPDISRHYQIATTKYVYGLLKQYPQNTVAEEIHDMFEAAMSTHLYGSPAEAKAQNAIVSLTTARKEAEPYPSEAIEKILHLETTVLYKGFRNKFLIDVNEEIQPPQVALYINNEIFGTLGNFSLFTGKAKAKKSFVIALAVSAALSDKVLQGVLKSELPAKQKEVLYIDTEQAKYHVQLAVKRICGLVGVSEPTNLKAFHLRSLTPAERLQFIEEEIYSNDNIGIVFIDGIKDLITSINDEAEASMIASKLLKWSEERNIHIVTVLHQNKGDNNARGHVGTELINKAETVLSVTVLDHDKEISIVAPEQCRNREPEAFAFRVDENGLPFIISEFETEKPKKVNPSNVYELQSSELFALINEAFAGDTEIKYAELVRKVKITYSNQKGLSIGDNKARDIISLCKVENLINQKGDKQPYTLCDVLD